MPKGTPPLGTTARATLTVLPSDLASTLAALPGESYPPVFATTRMIALMEIAAGRALGPYLAEGELSAGVEVEVVHAAATPVGAQVTAEARYLGRAKPGDGKREGARKEGDGEGKLYAFEVAVWDAGGEVGRGRHTRAVVEGSRIESGAKKRFEGKL